MSGVWEFLNFEKFNDRILADTNHYLRYMRKNGVSEKQVIHTVTLPWMTNNLKRLIRQRQKAFINGNNTTFKLFRNKVNRERKRCRKTYYNNKRRTYSRPSPVTGGER